jgi:hypothetical protein
VSQDIFKDDPFLLKGASQRAFGRALLKNVLVRRTALSGSTDLVDLYNPTSRPTRGPTTPPGPPPADLVRRYLQSRIQRTELSEEDREALMRITMLARGERTRRRLHPVPGKDGIGLKDKFLTHDEARKDLAGEAVDLDHRLRVAAVGFRVKISKLVDNAYLFEDLCVLEQLPYPQPIVGIPDDAGISQLGRTKKAHASQRRHWHRWIDSVCGHVQAALDRDSHFILLPEFALPPEIDPSFDIEARIRQRCKPKAGAQRHAHFIFAGSRHEGGVNRGLVLHGKDPEQPHPTEWHYKVASARSLGENILGPRSDVYSSYETEVQVNGEAFPFHVTVAICYDTFDPSTFLSLVLHTAKRVKYETEQIILVPSFNPSEQFVELLRDLSFLTSSTVVYINSLHGDAKAFIYGFAVSDLLDKSSDELVDQIAHHMIELRHRRTDAQHDIRDANRRGDTAAADEAHKRAGLLRDQLSKLKALQDGIRALQNDGGLRHLITVERCDDCVRGSHRDDYDCRTDILYYNIDARLLKTLQDWRTGYFLLDESFLPEPFHHDELAAEVANQAKREERRARRNQGP